MLKVWTTEDYGNLPEGSCLSVFDQEVDEDGDLWFSAYWSSMAGSYIVLVPASITTTKDPDEEMHEAVKRYLNSDEWLNSPYREWLIKNG